MAAIFGNVSSLTAFQNLHLYNIEISFFFNNESCWDSFLKSVYILNL